MNYQYINQPTNTVFRVNKRGLDRIKKQLDRMRDKQSEIYTHFKKKYNTHQLENIVSDEEMEELEREENEISAISSNLLYADRTTRRFSF